MEREGLWEGRVLQLQGGAPLKGSRGQPHIWGLSKLNSNIFLSRTVFLIKFTSSLQSLFRLSRLCSLSLSLYLSLSSLSSLSLSLSLSLSSPRSSSVSQLSPIVLLGAQVRWRTPRGTTSRSPRILVACAAFAMTTRAS